jgi:hypothetical protein
MGYQHLPPNLAQQLAALPLLIQRGRGNSTTVSAPAPLPFAEISARYAALQPVCIFEFLICLII